MPVSHFNTKKTTTAIKARRERGKGGMFASLFHAHVDLHVKGLPAWMQKMNPNKMSLKDRGNVVSVLNQIFLSMWRRVTLAHW